MKIQRNLRPMSILLWFWVFSSVFLTFVYAIVTLRYRAGWRAAPGWSIPPGWHPRTAVTVLVPARNEAETIRACLDSIRNGGFPHDLLEIIVIDDHSDDETAARAGTVPGVRVLRLADHLPAGQSINSYKKKALGLGIAHARGELIVTTDADCVAAGPGWLSLLVSAYECQPGTVAVAAPVLFHGERTVFERFQSLDFLGLMGITAAGLHRGTQRLANGANLAYARAAFFEVGGFSGNDDRASGDDMFLVQKLARRYPDGLFFVKNPSAAVLTRAKPDLASFVQQRLRWGTKNAALPEWGVRLSLAAVFLCCWSVILNAVLAPGWWPAGAALAVQLAVKSAVDYAFLRSVAFFFGRKDLLRAFLPAQGLHILYMVVVGTGSLVVRQYGWKGRTVR